jgi:hypothetical protein
MVMIVYQSAELMVGKEIEVLGGNLPQCRFVHLKFHMI